MNGPSSESVELFLQEASENLQYLREYSGILQEPQTRPDDLEKLYIAAHTLAGTSASYGFPQFSEVGAKMAHIFHYAMHATLTPDMHGPLTEFISDAISVLEFDLLQISSNGEETDRRHRRVQAALLFRVSARAPASESRTSRTDCAGGSAASRSPTSRLAYSLRRPFAGRRRSAGDEVLEFFVPEAEEHLQAVTECLLALEAQSEPRRDQSPVPLDAHDQRFGGAGRIAPAIGGRASRRGSDRPASRRRAASQRRNRGHLPRVGGRFEEIPAPPMGGRLEMRAAVDPLLARIAEICSGRSAEDAVSEGAASSCRRFRCLGTLLLPVAARRNVSQQARAAASQVRAHLARPPGPHDECRRRAGHQPHAHGWPSGGIGQAGRSTEFLEEPPVWKSFRVPGKARIQPNPSVALCRSPFAPQMDTFRPPFTSMPSDDFRATRWNSANSKWTATTISTFCRAR